MSSSRTATIRLFRLSLIGFGIIIIVIYAIWRSLNYISGPSIDIFQPIDGSAISSTTVTIIGRANRVNSLLLNGKTIFIDEAGNFTETIIVFPGLNVVTFTAKDQFGRTDTEQLQLVGTLEE